MYIYTKLYIKYNETYTISGLSMSIVHRDSKKICFVFDHSKEYQKFHTLFVSEIQAR